MATPTVVAVGTVGQNTGTGNPTAPGIPTGTALTHCMLCFVVSSDNVASTVAGFTNKPELTGNNGTLQRFSTFYKWAIGGDTAPTVTHTAGNGCSAVIISVSGLGITSGDPFAVLGTPSLNASSTTVTASGITPAGLTDLVFWFGVSSIAGTSSPNSFSTVAGTNPAFTSRVNNANGLGSNEIDFSVQTGPSNTGAATGTRTSTLSVAGTPNMGVMFTLNDASGSAAPTTFSTANLPLLRMLVQGGLQRAKALALMFPPQVVVTAPAALTGDAADTLTTGETVTTTVSLVRGCSDSVTFAETPSRTAQSFSRPLPVDSVTFSETPVSQRGLTRPVSDSVTFTETPSRLAQGFSRPLPTDSVHFAEVASRTAQGFSRLLSVDSVTFSESLVGQRGLTRLVSDSVTFAETPVRAALARVRAATDSVTFGESLARVLSVSKAPTDSVTFSESPTGQRGLTRLITDAVAFGESLARGAFARVRAITGSVTFSESVASSGTGGQTRTATDTVTFTETPSRTAQAFSRTAPGSLTFSETPTRGKGVSRSVTDSLTSGDTPVILRSWVRAPQDSVTLTEVLTLAGGTRPRTVVDAVTFTDVASVPDATIYGHAEGQGGGTVFAETTSSGSGRGELDGQGSALGEGGSTGLVFAEAASAGAGRAD